MNAVIRFIYKVSQNKGVVKNFNSDQLIILLPQFLTSLDSMDL